MKSANPSLWLGLTLAAIGATAGLKLSGAIDATTGFILLVFAFVPALMFVRALGRKRGSASCVSEAVYRYNRGMIASGLGYALGLGIAITVHRRFDPEPLLNFGLALLPAIPILAMIWTMARYLIEEHDEYLRHRAMLASLFGLAVLLAISAFWGFLETFGIAPHAEGWWAFPIWALAMGAAQVWMGFTNRAESGE